MSVHRICLPLLLATVLSGCHSHGLLVKRDSELNCPTDIRRTVPWCAGEDAIFRCPCGPSDDFYGHKPTCWRTWPAPAAVWRDSYCGGQPVGEAGSPMPAVQGEMLMLPPTEEPETSNDAGLDKSVPAPQLEELPPTSSVLGPGGAVGRGEQTGQAVAGSAPPGWLTPRQAASNVAGTPLPPRQLGNAIPETLAPRHVAGEAPVALPPRQGSGRTPTALAPRRAQLGAPAALPPRSQPTGSVAVPLAPTFSVTPVTYASATPLVDGVEPTDSGVVDPAVRAEVPAIANGDVGDASLAIVETPPSPSGHDRAVTPQSRRRSLLDAFISPANEDGGQEAEPHNWNLVR